MFSNSFDLISDYTQDFLYGTVCLYELRLNEEGFIEVFSVKVSESRCMFPQEHKEGLFHIFIFMKAKKMY